MEWRGRADGTYSVRALDVDIAAGTQVYLRCRAGKEDLFRNDSIKDLALHYGVLLPYPIRVKTSRTSLVVNEEGAPWRREYSGEKARTQALLRFGKQAFATAFLDAIPLHSRTGRVGRRRIRLAAPGQPQQPAGPSCLPAQHAALRGSRQPAPGLGVLRQGHRQCRRLEADRVARELLRRRMPGSNPRGAGELPP